MMKYGIFSILILASVSVFSAEAEPDFQALAENHFKGMPAVTYTPRSAGAVTHNFRQPVDRVSVDDMGNFIRRFGFWSECSGLRLMAVSCAVKEIYIYAGDEVLNCYVRFESEPGKEIKVKGLVECD